MWKQKYQNNNQGFTTIEIIVTMGIVVILAGVLTTAVIKASTTAKQTVCRNNMREISQGMRMYYDDKGIYPEDGYPDDANDTLPLSSELEEYVFERSSFVCPEDNDQTSNSNFASYDPYYVARKGSHQEGEVIIGCPRHREAKKAISLFRAGSTEITKIGTVMANGEEIPPDGTTAQRTINNTNDVMTFADGSVVTITDTTANSGTFLVQSVQLSDGTLYSIIRVKNDGEIDVQVTSGSKFEVITPSAIVGVRGTRFLVETYNQGYTTKVTIITGIVIVTDRATGQATTLTSDGITEITIQSVEEDKVEAKVESPNYLFEYELIREKEVSLKRD